MAKRIFFGSSVLAVRSKYVSGYTDGVANKTLGSWRVPRGIQSVGFSTSVAFEPMFQMGQTEVYGRMESQSPEVECTISKAIDGGQPLYTTLLGGHTVANNKLPVELSDNEVELELGVYAESVPYASGAVQSAIYCSGMYVSNVSITLPLDGVATEEVTLIGDHKEWRASASTAIGSNIGNDSTERGWIGSGTAPTAYQRWKFKKDASDLPYGVDGWPLQSVTVTMSMGREAIQELGTRGKYCRYATFPFEVTSEFEVIGGKAVAVGASDTALVEDNYNFVNNFEMGCSPDIEGGFEDQTIKIVVCDEASAGDLEIDLGTKNRVTSVNHAGGDTGGGNVTLTYSFQNYNFLKLNATGGAWATDPTTTFS